MRKGRKKIKPVETKIDKVITDYIKLDTLTQKHKPYRHALVYFLGLKQAAELSSDRLCRPPFM